MRIDLSWMLREGLAREGRDITGSLSWTCGGSPSGSISYRAMMSQPEQERLELSYKRGSGGEAEQVKQSVHLSYTEPHFGGKRWFMICPYRGVRAGKLYLPPGGDRFACRKAWRLGYQSQRVAPRDKPFEQLFRLQEKLGCERGWGNYPRRPKGMWRSTYERHMERFEELDALCDAQMAHMEALVARWR